MLEQDQALDPGILFEYFDGFFGELETRHNVGHQPQPAAIEIGATLGGVGLIGNAEDRRRMGMVDKFMRHKGVQQSFDRRVGCAGIDQIGPLNAHHLLVGQCLALA